MVMPTRYSMFFNESLQKQQKILPICGSLKAEDRQGTISPARVFVGWYIHSFRGYKLNSLSRRCLAIWNFTDEGIGIYPIWTKYVFCPIWMGWTKYLDQKNK